MTTIDIVILIVLGAGAIVGFTKGFLKQLAGLLGLVAGLLIAKALYATVAERFFLPLTDSLTVAQGIAFVVIWLAVPLAFLLLATLLTKAMEAVALGWVNRLLGAGLGLLKSALLVSLLICVVEYIDSDNTLLKRTKKQESVLYYPMEKFAGIFLPAAREVAGELLQ
ncbi:CvpA family protein [Mediterranea massiliensis]|uniref:CvpA family protein n=1 Tax=Mediterranea massiliensis TaxID=1841865 RepID=A0ABS2E1M1_9BACT|nr:CvpA family protein [Mediterranea massiliensis]MBM6735542.1 CvpA family protein [Mediterranea massiliensis]CCZ46996.1 putative bacteriocin [Bacteroides sp. CAG:661]